MILYRVWNRIHSLVTWNQHSLPLICHWVTLWKIDLTIDQRKKMWVVVLIDEVNVDHMPHWWLLITSRACLWKCPHARSDDGWSGTNHLTVVDMGRTRVHVQTCPSSFHRDGTHELLWLVVWARKRGDSSWTSLQRTKPCLWKCSHARADDGWNGTNHLRVKGRKAWGASKEELAHIPNSEVDEDVISPLQSSRSRRTWKPKWSNTYRI